MLVEARLSGALHVLGQGIAAQCDEACASENVVSSKGASHLAAIHAGKPNVAEDHLGLAGAGLGDAWPTIPPMSSAKMLGSVELTARARHID